MVGTSNKSVPGMAVDQWKGTFLRPWSFFGTKTVFNNVLTGDFYEIVVD